MAVFQQNFKKQAETQNGQQIMVCQSLDLKLQFLKYIIEGKTQVHVSSLGMQGGILFFLRGAIAYAYLKSMLPPNNFVFGLLNTDHPRAMVLKLLG